MPAQADIIVSSPDSTEVRMVVEAKLRVVDIQIAENQIKRFMLLMRCPLGLLVLPDRIWIYRDRFTSDSEDSIEKLGDFDISRLVNFGSAVTDPISFENAVQAWLENLASNVSRKLPNDPQLQEIVDHYILPAVETGIVRAAGPR
jgi:hypothetical protein